MVTGLSDNWPKLGFKAQSIPNNKLAETTYAIQQKIDIFFFCLEAFYVENNEDKQLII